MGSPILGASQRSSATRSASANSSPPSPALRGETRASSLELSPKAGKHLVSGSASDGARIDLLGATAHLMQPRRFYVWVGRSVQFFPQYPQKRFLISRAKGANFFLNPGKWPSHAITVPAGVAGCNEPGE